jgi:hypothetical protein
LVGVAALSAKATDETRLRTNVDVTNHGVFPRGVHPMRPLYTCRVADRHCWDEHRSLCRRIATDAGANARFEEIPYDRGHGVAPGGVTQIGEHVPPGLTIPGGT